MSSKASRQIVNDDVNKWDGAIRDAQVLLQKAENRAARLKGAIKTFTELRDHGQQFSDREYKSATQC
jgi:hypothetical protein